MAAIPHLTFSHFLSLSKIPTTRKPLNSSSVPSYTNSTTRNKPLKIRASDGPDMVGDFGARDPFPAEIESNFADKVLGNVSTEHKILIPNASALSLATLQCVPVSQIQQPLTDDEVKMLMFKVVGWRIVEEEGITKLRGLWKLRNTASAEELISRINKAVESTGHLQTLSLEAPNGVRAELWTSSIGGVSLNDFIVAAKIDEIKISDLLPRQRAWA